MSSSDDQTFAYFERRAAALRAGGTFSVPDHVPAREYRRTPAASRIAELARAEGLFHFHFERRAHLELPEDWAPESDPDLAQPPTWHRGVLPERKYQSFRHDLPIASFHPHHRGKWAIHELCHGLVGFAWRPDATPFFHATAGRLAELLPVAIWYFFDEAFLTRCPDHQGQGALFRTSCIDCERVAAARPDDPKARHWIERGNQFLDDELAAISQTRATGRLVPHRYATLDLCSDGLAYAVAHQQRLQSDTTRRFAERFWQPGHGCSDDLDALTQRVIDVKRAITEGMYLEPFTPSPVHGRFRWILQDVAWRLATTQHQCAGDVSDALDKLIDGLAEAHQSTLDAQLAPPTLHERMTSVLTHTHEAYAELETHYELPPGEDLFALGYHAPATSPAVFQVTEGLISVAPLTMLSLGDRGPRAVAYFSDLEGFNRAPLVRRFSDHLSLSPGPDPLADLCRWEAALAAVPHTAPPRLTGPGEGLKLVSDVQVLSFDHDVVKLAERIDAGELEPVWDAQQLRFHAHEGDAPVPEPTAIVLGREASGDLLILDIDPHAAAALRSSSPADLLPPEEIQIFRELGILVPATLHERRSA